MTEISENRFISIRQQVATLFPGYFALVMATGIISIAAYLLNMKLVASILLWGNIIFYMILAVLLLLRLVFYFSRVAKDVTDHERGPGFFTIVAGTCILGTQLFVLTDNILAAKILLIVGSIFWFIIIYAFFTAITIKKNKPGIEKGINGAWLIVIVATQSVSILSTFVSQALLNNEVLLFFALCMYLVGGIFYIMIIALIFYRFSFFVFKPTELAAPYWINVGATAITTLSGACLMLNGKSWVLLQDILPFIKGFTLFFWSAGSWWIPLFLILGVWRHFVRKIPLPFRNQGYNPSYWSMVVPLGMYTACTSRLSEALDFKMLMVIPRYFIYIAFASWIMVFSGLVHQLFIKLREKRRGY